MEAPLGTLSLVIPHSTHSAGTLAPGTFKGEDCLCLCGGVMEPLDDAAAEVSSFTYRLTAQAESDGPPSRIYIHKCMQRGSAFPFQIATTQLCSSTSTRSFAGTDQNAESGDPKSSFDHPPPLVSSTLGVHLCQNLAATHHPHPFPPDCFSPPTLPPAAKSDLFCISSSFSP